MVVDPYLVSGGVCFSFPVAPEGPRLLSPSAPTSRPPAESDPRHEWRRGRLGASEAWTRELGPILIIGHRNPQPGRQPFESHKAARYELSSADAATHWFFNRRDKKSSRGTWQAALLAGHSAFPLVLLMRVTHTPIPCQARMEPIKSTLHPIQHPPSLFPCSKSHSLLATLPSSKSRSYR